jgi:hypothetical protein
MTQTFDERLPAPQKMLTTTGSTKVGNSSAADESAELLIPSRTVICPLCGSEIPADDLPEGIDDEGLSTLREHVHTGKLIPMLELAEVVSRNLDPSKMGVEIQVKEYLTRLSKAATAILEKQMEFFQRTTKGEKEEKAVLLETAMNEQKDIVAQYEDQVKELQEQQVHQLESFNKAISDIREKLVGTGIGKVAEMITIKELKSAFPQDGFSNRKASKGMADIIATINEKGTQSGKVVISVKSEAKWSEEFLDQLRRNLEDEGARWGMIVTVSFPADALNDKMSLTQDGFFLVKPEYAPVAYQAMRQAAIQWHEAQRWVRDKEEQLKLNGQITEVIREWLRGDHFGKVMRSIDTAVNESRQTDELLVQLNRYAERKVGEMRKIQGSLRESLIAGSDLLGELKQRLESAKPVPQTN